METRLAPQFKNTPAGTTAEGVLRACVHCGFCNATCPTYQLVGDELDGPRGRLYQMKQVLEGVPATRATQLHLDRCLTCRSCETTCPSGVEYSQLLEIGRAEVDRQVVRPWTERLFRWMLREGLTRQRLFGVALGVARALRLALPQGLQAKVGVGRSAGSWPTRTHARRVLLLNGCTQPAMAPSIDAATARVLDRIGVQAVVDPASGCCGAIRQHLGDPQGALENARRNIDAWWPQIERGTAEAIVINASGCGAMISDYGRLLAHDPAYAAKAARVSRLMRDVASFLAPEAPALMQSVSASGATRIAFQPPCSQQHGLRIRGEVEGLLKKLGADLVSVADGHLCCGSAGTYSLLQTELSTALRVRKLGTLLATGPDLILSANIGCIGHLEAGTDVPVRHWIEWVDGAMQGPPG
ncbi:MAG: glycolate oxidase subunit GlcF [Steroidobacteraceae bacterium]